MSARSIVLVRDGVWCVRSHPDGRKRSSETHHRRTKGMGGTRRPESETACNLVRLCSACHQWVTDMGNRRQAEREGLYVPQDQDPRTTPLLWRGRFVLMLEDGTVMPVPDPE